MDSNKIRLLLSKDYFCMSLLMLFVFSIVSIVIYLGIPFHADFPQHFQFALTYYEAFKSGNFFPAWSAYENYGYGGIGIRIYPPIAHVFLAFTQLITNDWFTSTWLNLLFWMAFGCIGIYLFAKEWLSPANSLLVGMLYAFAPYRLAQFFKDFLYSEFIAAAILPFCFLYLKKVCQNDDKKNIFLLSFFLSLLILSHIPTTIIASICFGIFTVLILDWKNFYGVFFRLIASGTITLLMTSFYWVRLLTEIGLVNHNDPKYASGYFNYTVHLFPRISASYELYFARMMWLNDSVAFITLLLIIPFLILLIWKLFQKRLNSKLKKEYLALGITCVAAFFMITTLSSPIWANFQFIQKIQFPFRWLSIATLFSCIIFVIAISNISINSSLFSNLKKYSLVIFFIILFLFNITQIIIPSEILSRTAFAEKLDGLLESESYQCWWTVWSKIDALGIKEKVNTPSRKIEITNWESESRKFKVEAGEIESARIATFYYPHWQAFVNQQKVEIERNVDGTINIPLSKESAEVSLIFVEPFLLKFAKIISLISWLAIIFLSLSFLRKSNLKTIKSII